MSHIVSHDTRPQTERQRLAMQVAIAFFVISAAVPFTPWLNDDEVAALGATADAIPADLIAP